tara:strand:+ start:44 stop:700 length:657 start_codon:yes stop_codon:yes gene_type:complete
MVFHDVSVTISEDLPVWPGDPSVSLKLTSSIARGDTANVTQIKMGAHTGTHIDAPYHFEPNGKTIDQLAINTLIGPCRVIEMLNIEGAIGPSALEKVDLDGATRILFKTKNSEWWGYGEKEFKKNYTYINEQGAEFLIARGVKLVGIDYLSVERYDSPDHATHHLLLRSQIVIIEGLNLNDVSMGDYELIALPLKLKGCDGGPARVILRENNLQKNNQ